MSYQVLARKWRPRLFSELVGQEHVQRALINALDNDRLHHAYLFTGTRGVGKTTIARILAKALNCEAGVSSTPCGTCSSCVEIDEGRFVDLIEVDAASRTRVEDTRELLDNVQYAPTRGRYKVYLIDEVHMLSGHSFNALLKTLEEPPPHVKFLLATTDPQKLPMTILSRCLQFSLKSLSISQISGQLTAILGKEQISADDGAVRQLAFAADGSMRDALSLLDQAIGFGGGVLREAEVRSMLGTIDRDAVYRLLQALAAADAAALLDEVGKTNEFAPDYAALLADMLSVLQRICWRTCSRCCNASPWGRYCRMRLTIPLVTGMPYCSWPGIFHPRMCSCITRSACLAGVTCRWRRMHAAGLK
jgi:DNA polymerase-3 subunit gamma/tau